METKRMPYLWAYIVTLVLVTSSQYVLLDAFLIATTIAVVDPSDNPVFEATPDRAQVEQDRRT